ncbi:RnfABCDGE type electron transport complex subunit D [Candidatus Gottesmanbacteria bacterium]|nr:RnfABCDGE type electron transport complex subunit D [Candidatus Gottesmanbacteria bacterium]
MEVLRRSWRDSRGKVIVTLLVLWVAALVHQFSLIAFLYPIVAVLVVSALDQLFTRLRFGRDIFSLSSVVTGFLIGLILDPKSAATTLLLACLIASLAKQFIAKGLHRHMFNPAAIGLVGVSVVPEALISWWGVSWGLLPVAIILVGIFVVLRQLGRLWMPITFLLVYIVSLTFFHSLETAIRLTVDGTVFLFAFVMITEPMTSVNSKWWRYGWGILVGLLVVVHTILGTSWTDPLLLGLLVANLLGFLLVRRRVLRSAIGSV